MDEIASGIAEAFKLIVNLDPEVRRIGLFSLQVSGAALLLAALAGIPYGVWLAFARFSGRRLVIGLTYAGMAFPTVVVGLMVFLILSHNGPLGFLGWLFTPLAIIAAQFIIAFPVISSFTVAAILGINPEMRQQLRSLGATRWQTSIALLREARLAMIVALAAAFGRVVTEVGAVIIVGGNIAGSTRVLTTAIVLETRKGAFDTAIALGIILLLISFSINILATRLQGRALSR
ncbi:MAG: ABC transporter permease [Dehalococcoidia bacterium]